MFSSLLIQLSNQLRISNNHSHLNYTTWQSLDHLGYVANKWTLYYILLK